MICIVDSVTANHTIALKQLNSLNLNPCHGASGCESTFEDGVWTLTVKWREFGLESQKLESRQGSVRWNVLKSYRVTWIGMIWSTVILPLYSSPRVFCSHSQPFSGYLSNQHTVLCICIQSPSKRVIVTSRERLLAWLFKLKFKLEFKI